MFYFSPCATPFFLHSFPTRRSSDLSSERLDGHYVRADREPRDHIVQEVRVFHSTTRRTPSRSATVGFQSHVRDRKSTRLNSSHVSISYAVFCLKKKKLLLHRSLNVA